MDPKSNDKCPEKRQKRRIDGGREEECEDRGREWSAAGTSQGTLDSSRQRLKRPGRQVLPESLGGSGPCPHLHFKLPASRTVRE